jgi:hypothetical protein
MYSNKCSEIGKKIKIKKIKNKKKIYGHTGHDEESHFSPSRKKLFFSFLGTNAYTVVSCASFDAWRFLAVVHTLYTGYTNNVSFYKEQQQSGRGHVFIYYLHRTQIQLRVTRFKITNQLKMGATNRNEGGLEAGVLVIKLGQLIPAQLS